MERRTLVYGGRNFCNITQLFRVLDKDHARLPISLIISGGAIGADRLAVEWAKDRGVLFKVFKPTWEDLTYPDAVIKKNSNGAHYDAMAGFRRNQRMLDEGKPTDAIGFPGGNGTADMLDRIVKAGIPHTEVKHE